MLGVLGADAAFLPLDPAYPPQRLRFMLEDARPAVVLVDAASADALPPHDGQTLTIEDLLADPVVADVASAATAETLAYVIYTSGSTGRPKGVMVPHRGIVNLALAQIRAFGIDARAACCSSPP